MEATTLVSSETAWHRAQVIATTHARKIQNTTLGPHALDYITVRDWKVTLTADAVVWTVHYSHTDPAIPRTTDGRKITGRTYTVRRVIPLRDDRLRREP